MSAKPKAKVIRVYYRPGILAMEQWQRGGKLHGRQRDWYRNGQLAREDFYQHGLLHGICRQWNEDGKLLETCRMENGTGLRRSYYENGRLNVEYSLVAGDFCGRSRRWLRDGTLSTDEVLLFNHRVTPAEYRQAADEDPRLPKLVGRMVKPKLTRKAEEQRTFRLFLAWWLAKKNGRECRSWLTAADKKKRLLGRFKNSPAALKFVDELYQAGAVKVTAPDIYCNKRGDEFADNLVVQLPRSPAQRKAIRAVCAQLKKADTGSFAPSRDWGEQHLYVSMS